MLDDLTMMRRHLMATGGYGERARVERDDHHVLNDRVHWEANAIGRDVRQRVIARHLSRTVHDLLHANETVVPVPSPHTLQRVYNNLPRGLYIFEAMDRYCDILERANKHPKIKPLEIDLNNLSIQAVQNQIPYLRDGLPPFRTMR